MITEQELQALVSILSRVPLTPAEALWLQALLDRLAQAAKVPSSSPLPDTPHGR